ncbi:C-type lectin Cal-like [Apteryx mantelli]|uniref:C-type lectin Cal-like n=1 Tax=Apteryx mantelli TaxID=2696672 RepID=A0ABM4EV51_9AVES
MSAGSTFLRCLLGCLLFAAFVGETWASSCPPQWLYYRGYCYGYFTHRKTWDEAERECERYGPRGRLASIHTLQERKALSKYISQHMDHENTWIGLHDEDHDRSWKWSDNSILNVMVWAQGQPDDDNNENCVVMESSSGFQEWHNYPCDSPFPFLCKFRL